MLALVLTVLSCALSTSDRVLPEGNLILGYATACGGNLDSDVVVHSARSGVNVINWFAINLVTRDGVPVIEHQLNLTCVALTAWRLKLEGLGTAHLITVGGWDAPHVNTSLTGSEWWEKFNKWNREEVASLAFGFNGFDGIDWDLEGNDILSSEWNHFTIRGIEAVGRMSQAAKDAGLLVTLVPPESYFDSTTSLFDLSLLHAYPEWHPEFKYHGRSCYAALLLKYGLTPRGKRTFDLVDIQLYESWAHAAYQIDVQMVPASEYLVRWVNKTLTPWQVEFDSVPELQLPSQPVVVTPDQLIVGFSFGSSDGKEVFIEPADVSAAWMLLPADRRPRGVMFWNIELDGGYANGTTKRCYMAQGFNSFLHTRTVEPADTRAEFVV